MSEARAPFSDFQNEIYAGGLAGERLEMPFSLEELERKAEQKLDRGAFGYVAGAAGSEDTLRANLRTFRRWRIVPRMLRDTANRKLSVNVLGTDMPAPVMLDPIGVQSIVHPEAEVAPARAAASLGVPVVLITASSKPLEEAYLPFLHLEGLANYLTDPAFTGKLPKSPEEDPLSAALHFAGIFNPQVTWEDLAFLRENTSLPILLKGILHPDDARQARDRGMDGVVVSNHGGRQVDGAIAALEALPPVVDAVGDNLPVLFDSGIRTGADAFKALALGARAVLLGRPYIWGLALGGENGVRQVLRALLAELDVTMGLAGYSSVPEIGPEALVRVEPEP